MKFSFCTNLLNIATPIQVQSHQQLLLPRTSNAGTVGRCATVNFPRQRLHSSNHPCKETGQRNQSCLLQRRIPMWKSQAKKPPNYNHHLCMRLTGNWMKLACPFRPIIYMETIVSCEVSMAVDGIKHHSHTATESLSIADEEQRICLLRAQPFLELASIVGRQPIVPSKGVLWSRKKSDQKMPSQCRY